MKLRDALIGALLTATAGTASAGVYVVDDFSVDQGPIVDSTDDGVAVSNTLGDRTITSNLIAHINPIVNSTSVIDDHFEINNEIGEQTEVQVDWVIGADMLPDATSAIFTGMILAADLPTSMDFFFNGSLIDTVDIALLTLNEAFSFAIDPDVFNVGGILSMVIVSHPVAQDLALDQFEITYQVPSPSTLALVGLGLVGAGLSRRRRQA